MNKMSAPGHIWMWTKGYTTYQATLYNNTFIVRDVSLNNMIILTIRDLTESSQKRIVESMHTIKNKPGVIWHG